jgi:SPP1 family predicted phage head-tail adaptor
MELRRVFGYCRHPAEIQDCNQNVGCGLVREPAERGSPNDHDGTTNIEERQNKGFLMYNKGEKVGQLRHRVTIRQYTEVRDSFGGQELSWSDLAVVWAEVEHKEGGSDEGEEMQRQTAIINARFRMRYRSDIDEKMRLLWDSKLWNIKSILPDSHFSYMTIEAEHQIT